MEITYNHSGQILPFMLDEGVARGRLVRITNLSFSQEQLQSYPEIILSYLAQLICLGSALIGDIKNNGSITLQITGGKIINLIVVEINQNGFFRNCARISEENQQLLQNHSFSFKELFENGQFVLTSKLHDFNEEHQAVIEISGDTLEACLTHYFIQSSQIPTIVKILYQSQELSSTNDFIAGMLFIQKLPYKNDHNISIESEDLWNTYKIFIDTLLPDEMLNPKISDQSILYRLFNQHIIHVFPQKQLHMQCKCSQEKIDQLIFNLEKDILEENSQKEFLNVDCNFCQKQYTVDLKKLFKR